MRLILSSHNPRNALYSTEAGQVLYKTDKSGSSVTSLRKAVGHGNFALYAEVEFHTFRSTRFRFDNADVSVDEFFHKEGWFNPKWVFRASDGKNYYWKLDGRYLEMFRKGGSKQRVVKFRERKRSFIPFITGSPPSLEVDNSCTPVLDDIIATLVYCQRQRRNRQRSASASAGAGVSASGGTSC